MGYRLEHDLLGEMQVPEDAYYGIHTLRASHNFPISGRPVHRELIQAMVVIKKAAAIANMKLGLLEQKIGDAIVAACDRILRGEFDDQFIVDRIQGGAGTSTNMNVNEVVANVAIEQMGGQRGDYTLVHPLNHVNMSQSTNDVYPTALRIAAINLLKPLSEEFAALQEALQKKENEFSSVIKMGRTELQDAVPIMLGQEFGAYAQAIARDRWRLYKVEERLRQVPLGGTAVGTGLNADVRYIYTVVDVLRDLTGLGLARTEYMMDGIQNADVFVEVSGLLKAAAVNLGKIANDLRLLSSGPECGLGEIKLPAMQAGSSIMPGKVNPIIPEMVNMVVYQVIGNDLTITMAAESGQLELNAMIPLIASNLLESIEMMTNAVKIFIERCVSGIEANVEVCNKYVYGSKGLVTALVPYIGYDNATKVADVCRKENKAVEQAVLDMGLMSRQELERALNPYDMTKPGIKGIRRDGV
ncbi:aspartate ammonia-lyase [Caldanaerobius polysaccharolyticus]|uniref:aspartate ammonia-lyase n=1 Tax=Caldanaerobius polysaccharolyticus TaxID=44256 RepID=UPI000479E894|nr:aspartate ammonia-lyase [Caldanaerobius polysaccharolyticus]